MLRVRPRHYISKKKKNSGEYHGQLGGVWGVPPSRNFGSSSGENHMVARFSASGISVPEFRFARNFGSLTSFFRVFLTPLRKGHF